MAIIKNTGSGNDAVLSGNATLLPQHIIRFGDATGQVDTGFDFPTTHDWLLFEVIDAEGVVADVGYTRWTDKVGDAAEILATFNSFKAIVDADTAITNYTIAAMRFKGGTNLCDTYAGNQASAVSLDVPDVIFYQPPANWLITNTKVTPTYTFPFQLEFTLSQTYSNINVVFNAGSTLYLRNLTTGTEITSSSTGSLYYDPGTATHRFRLYATDAISTFNVVDHVYSSSVEDVDLISCIDMYALDYTLSNLEAANVTISANIDHCTSCTYLFAYSPKILNLNIPSLAHFTDLSGVFRGLYYMTDLSNVDISGATNLFETFYGCVYLTSLPTLPTTSISNAAYTFYNCNFLVTSPNLNVANSTTLAFTYYNCYRLTSLSLTNTSGVLDWGSTFLNCWVLSSFPVLDTSAGTNFDSTFWGCKVPIPALDTTSGINFTEMFRNTTAGLTIPNLNTSNGEVFTSMFQDSGISIIPPLDLRASTTLNDMFYNSTASIGTMTLTNVTNFAYLYRSYKGTVIADSDYSSGQICSSMFANCTALVTPLNLTAAVTHVDSMFLGYHVATTLPNFNFSNCLNVYGCFQYCSSTLGAIELDGLLDASGLFAHYSGTSLPAFIDLNTVTNTYNMFQNIQNVSTIPALVLGAATQTSNMFTQCLAALTTIDTSAVLDMSEMFRGYSIPITLTVLNTSNCTNFDYAFADTTGTIPNLDLTSATTVLTMFSESSATLGTLNTTGMTNFNSMFYTYRGDTIPALDMTLATTASYFLRSANNITTFVGLNTTGMTNFANMFRLATNQQWLPPIDTSSGTLFTNMFNGATALVCLNTIDTTNQTDTTGMFSSTTISAPTAIEQTALLAGASYTNPGSCPI